MIRRTVVIGALVVSCLTLHIVNAAAQAPTFLTSWQTSALPLGMAIDAGGLLYVGAQNGGSARAYIYSQAGAPLGTIPGSEETYGVCFLHEGPLLLADYYGHRVTRYYPWGAAASTWQLPGSNALYLAVDDSDNSIFVTSDNSDQVFKVDRLHAGLVVWSSPHPSGVAYLDGKVYVAGMWNGMVSIYATDGTPLGSFPTGATWAEQLSADATGDLLLADHGLHRLMCFRPDGTLLWIIGPTVPGYGPGTCDFISVVSGSGGTILAGDYANRRVLVFGPQPTATTTASWGGLKAKYR